MFAHFARDMGEHIALTGEINAEHRSWQYLGHRSFHHERGFFRHRKDDTPRASPLKVDWIAERLPAKRSANIRLIPGASTTRRFVDVRPQL